MMYCRRDLVEELGLNSLESDLYMVIDIYINSFGSSKNNEKVIAYCTSEKEAKTIRDETVKLNSYGPERAASILVLRAA